MSDSSDTQPGDATATVSLSSAAEAFPPPKARLTAGSSFGRYMVLDEAGAGGMGVVYRAYDPKLQREVAIKRVSFGTSPSELDTSAEERLLREAQAMAQLAHPHVVPVYDVDSRDGELFIVMEFVEGQTLREWLRSQRRSWREVVGIFLQVGRGLAAAHAAGLIHRDLKPANVLIGALGRARVMDFGLARASGTADEGPIRDLAMDPASHSVSGLSAQLTAAGIVIGTPAYMAPEQHRGATTDAKSDQYSYCIALFEALYGTRPFRADNLASLVEKKEIGVASTPHERRVPRWVERIVLRGLAPEPDERWPSIQALLDALARDPATRWRWVVGGAVLVGGLGALARTARPPEEKAPCLDVAANANQLWTPDRREAIETAFAAAMVPDLDAVMSRLDAAVTERVEKWKLERTQACEATWVRREQSESTHDRRVTCLRRSIRTLDRLLAALSEADAGLARRALEAVYGVRDPAQCADPAFLASDRAPPPPEHAERIEELGARLAEAEALELAGRDAGALEIARELVAEVETIEYRPFLAEINSVLGTLEQKAGRFEAARETLERAYFDALATGAFATAADSGTQLVFLLGESMAKTDSAHEWARHTQAVIEHGALGDVMRARLLNNVGTVHYNAGQWREAEAHHRRALAIWERELAPTHPQLGTSHNNLANALHLLQELPAAVEHHEKAYEIWLAAFGPSHPMLAASLDNLANSLGSMGRQDEALAKSKQALELRVRLLGDDHVVTAVSRHNLGSIYLDRGELPLAKREFERAKPPFLSAFGHDHPNTAAVFTNLGDVARRLGDTEEAVASLEEGLAIFRALPGDDHPGEGLLLHMLGGLYAEGGESDRARSYLEQALTLRERIDAPAYELADSRFALAQLLWDSDPSRARSLAEKAQGDASPKPLPDHVMRADVERWLAEHPVAR